MIVLFNVATVLAVVLILHGITVTNKLLSTKDVEAKKKYIARATTVNRVLLILCVVVVVLAVIVAASL